MSGADTLLSDFLRVMSLFMLFVIFVNYRKLDVHCFSFFYFRYLVYDFSNKYY